MNAPVPTAPIPEPTDLWFAEGGVVLDQNRLPVAYVVGQDEDNADTIVLAAAPKMLGALRRAERELAIAARREPQASIALAAVREAIAAAEGQP